MTDKPIIFSSEMVRAILEGRKTMTRRIVKPQPVLNHSGAYDLGAGDFTFFHDAMAQHILENYNSPYGFAYADGTADRLWVREAFRFVGGYAEKPDTNVMTPRDCIYRADGEWDGKFSPSIHMPRSCSRITLEITDVRVERLQDITEEDAKKEGVNYNKESQDYDDYLYDNKNEDAYGVPTAKESIKSLWDKINGKRASWESNPFVWVITFKRL